MTRHSNVHIMLCLIHHATKLSSFLASASPVNANSLGLIDYSRRSIVLVAYATLNFRLQSAKQECLYTEPMRDA